MLRTLTRLTLAAPAWAEPPPDHPSPAAAGDIIWGRARHIGSN